MNRRHWEEKFFKGLMLAASGIILAVLLLILSTVLVRGLPSLNLSMILQTPRGGYYLGRQGGIANAIVGSLYLAGGATLLALLFSLPIALYLNVYQRPFSRLAALSRFSFDVLSGIPSIVFGAVGFTVMVALGLRASLLAGMITVSLFILPIMVRAMDEVLRLVPCELLDASYALGAGRLETAFRVALRQCLPGVVTAVLLAFGRAAGDAASVLLTAGFTDRIPSSLLQPAATLPLAIFFQLGSPYPEVQNRAYAAALILTLFILIISLSARWLTRRLGRTIIR